MFDDKKKEIVFNKVVYSVMRNKAWSVLQNVEWFLEEATI